MLLANAVLGHPEARDRLLLPRDVRGVLSRRTRDKASLYSNLFGANLGSTKRESLEIFDYLGRFGIGHETTNRKMTSSVGTTVQTVSAMLLPWIWGGSVSSSGLRR